MTAKLQAVGIMDQQRMLGGIVFRDQILAGNGAVCAQHPLGIVGGRDAPGMVPSVFDSQTHDFDRSVRRDVNSHGLFEAVAVMFENGVSRPVTNQIRGIFGRW